MILLISCNNRAKRPVYYNLLLRIDFKAKKKYLDKLDILFI